MQGGGAATDSTHDTRARPSPQPPPRLPAPGIPCVGPTPGRRQAHGPATGACAGTPVLWGGARSGPRACPTAVAVAPHMPHAIPSHPIPPRPPAPRSVHCPAARLDPPTPHTAWGATHGGSSDANHRSSAQRRPMLPTAPPCHPCPRGAFGPPLPPPPTPHASPQLCPWRRGAPAAADPAAASPPRPPPPLLSPWPSLQLSNRRSSRASSSCSSPSVSSARLRFERASCCNVVVICVGAGDWLAVCRVCAHGRGVCGGGDDDRRLRASKRCKERSKSRPSRLLCAAAAVGRRGKGRMRGMAENAGSRG